MNIDSISLNDLYKQFIEDAAWTAQSDSSKAEESLVNCNKQLYKLLTSYGFQCSVIQGIGFKGRLIDCSLSISGIPLQQRFRIKHIAVLSGSLVLDPCFKRLGIAVRYNHYPVMDFYNSWDMVRTVKSSVVSMLDVASLAELQFPIPTIKREKSYHILVKQSK